MNLFRKMFIVCFIILNILSMVRVHVPLGAKVFKTIYQPVDSYLGFFSIYQDWMMFAANPARVNTYISAEVEFDDGSKDSFIFPKPSEMNIFQKYLYGERYRKILSEGIRRDDHRWMWPDTAKFAMRKLKEKNFAKIPLKVRLYRHWSETPEMDIVFLPHMAKLESYQKYNFYTHEVL
jgi:hypothetical protein